MAEKRIRRSKKEVLIASISKIDEKIAKLNNQITALNNEREEFQKALKAEEAKADKAKQEEEMKRVFKIMKDRGVTAEEFEEFLNSREA